jgi:mRNA-degrading endonuclease toxin of MazEF toxin-antitoxin module
VSLARGGVYYVALPGVGEKPGLVVSWDPVNRGLRSAIVARITSRERERALPTHVELDPGEAGLPLRSYVLCHDLVTLPESDFGRQVGMLHPGRLLQVDEALRRALDLP